MFGKQPASVLNWRIRQCLSGSSQPQMSFSQFRETEHLCHLSDAEQSSHIQTQAACERWQIGTAIEWRRREGSGKAYNAGGGDHGQPACQAEA